jgi:hypothetical protein
MKAAEQQGSATATRERIRAMVTSERLGEHLVTRVLGRELGLTKE